MKKILAAIILFALLEACNQVPNTDRYFNYPVNKSHLPELSGMLSPERVIDDSYFYQFCFICDSLFVGISPPGYVNNNKFVTVTDLSTGKILGHFCDKGRGPMDYLSPIAADMQDGLLVIYDYMTARYSELDVEQSIAQGQCVFTRNQTIPLIDGESNAFLSIHKWGDYILAFDAGQNSDSANLQRMPDYVVIDQEDGRPIRRFGFFKDVPFSDKKRNGKVIPVKERLGQVDCIDCNEGKVCSVMGFIPQINIFDIDTGNALGIKVVDFEKSSLVNRVRHYQDVSAYRDRIYALYFGIEEQEIPLGTKDTEIHIFDWSGNTLSRYSIPGVYLSCQATEKGLYLTKLVEDRLQLYLISLNQMM